MKRAIIVILLLAAIGVTLYLSRTNTHNGQNTKEPLTTLKIGYFFTPGNYIVHIAEERGFFKDEGIVVESRDITPSAKINIEAFGNGELDILTTTNSRFYSSPELYKHGIVALMNYNPTNASVVIATGTINSPADLKGKRVGVNPGNDFFIYWMLSKYGLHKNDITLEIDEHPKLMEKLASGYYDAIFSIYPFSETLVRHGAGKIIYRAGESLGSISVGLAFQEKIVKEHPEIVYAFNRAYFRAYHWAKEHPSEAIESTSKWLNIPVADIQYIIENGYFFPDEKANNEILRYGTGIYNFRANIDYMKLFLGTTTSEDITSRITDRFIPMNGTR